MEKNILPIERLRRKVAPVALALGVTVMGACTETEPVAKSTTTTELTTTTATAEASKGSEKIVTPEAKQAEIKNQLVEMFNKVYTGNVAADSVERAPADEYSDVSYFEASATIGERKVTVVAETLGTGYEPQLDNVSFVMARVSALNKGGEPTVDSPDGSVTLAQVSVTSQEGFRPETVGFDSFGDFSTRQFEDDELMTQLDSAQSAINQISAAFGPES